MGGAMSEIRPSSTDVLLEAAFFDPMTIARSSKRHGLRTEGSNRFERGVDPQLALRAAARFVFVLKESVPDLEWLEQPLDVHGTLPTPPTLTLTALDVEKLLGVAIPEDDVMTILRGLGFQVKNVKASLVVTAPSNRLDIREGAPGIADVIEEIARLYGYRRLPRHSPTWPEPGALSERQVLRRRLRDIVVDCGVLEAWTPSLGSDEDFDLLHRHQPRVRITNPIAADESVLRATLITGLAKSWVRNSERGIGDVMLAEFGVVFQHPDAANAPRHTQGGTGGLLTLTLPQENERLTVILGRPNDDASSAVALWSVIAGRLGLEDVVVRSIEEAPRGLHPTRAGALVDRASGALVGHVGEVDAALLEDLGSSLTSRRLGLIDLDLDVLSDGSLATRTSSFASIPSRYPTAVLDLAFVTPRHVNAGDVAHALTTSSELVEVVLLFDVYDGPGVPEGTRSLAFNIRLGSADRTLSEREVSDARGVLINVASSFGAVLRS
jgi:phenylalanyl-tRNA synthetase beta chain